MEGLVIVGSVIGGLFIGIFTIRFFIIMKKKKKISDWKVGDVVIFTSKFWVKNNETINSAVLIGWNLDNFFIAYGGRTYVVDYDKLEINKSAVWRRFYSECEKTMGVKPNFNPNVDIKKEREEQSKINVINGKSIDLLTEIECQIYLKECLDKEDYETAELIKKQMEKYR